MAHNANMNEDLKKNITLGSCIGSGSYGTVLKGIWKANDGEKEVAVKQLKINSDVAEAEDQVNKEFKSLSGLKHPNIITALGIFKNDNNIIHIVLEYADCGSVYDFLHRNKDKDIKYIGKIKWMRQCAEGIAYLHEQNIAHRDIKTQNLLLFNDFCTVKLCDFGCVKKIASKNTAEVGTCLYMAPEVGNGDNYNTKCDVYSYGIVFWEVLSRKKPFYHLGEMKDVAISIKIINGERPSLEDIKDTKDNEKYIHIKPIIKQCWEHDPEKRPTMKGLAFILGLDPRSFGKHLNLITQITPLPDVCQEDFKV